MYSEMSRPTFWKHGELSVLTQQMSILKFCDSFSHLFIGHSLICPSSQPHQIVGGNRHDTKSNPIMGCGPSKSTGAAVATSAPSTARHLVDGGKATGAGQTSTSTAASTAPSTTASTTNAAGNRPVEEAAGRQQQQQQQQQRKQQPAGEFLEFFLLLGLCESVIYTIDQTTPRRIHFPTVLFRLFENSLAANCVCVVGGGLGA